MTSFYENIGGVRMHYEKLGSGPTIVLMIPGAIGTVKTDFWKQVGPSGLDYNEFTMIVPDLPGYGKTRPPEREYGDSTYMNDAKKSACLMERLGYKRYSVMGWCSGAKAALLLGIYYQGRVERLVVWAVRPMITPHDRRGMLALMDTSKWDPISRDLCERAYGLKLFEKLWHDEVENYVKLSWDIREQMKTIKCPVLILHGDLDPIIDKGHPDLAERLIPDSRLYRFRYGSHEPHQTHAKEFNRVVTEFLIEE